MDNKFFSILKYFGYILVFILSPLLVYRTTEKLYHLNELKDSYLSKRYFSLLKASTRLAYLTVMSYCYFFLYLLDTFFSGLLRNLVFSKNTFIHLFKFSCRVAVKLFNKVANALGINVLLNGLNAQLGSSLSNCKSFLQSGLTKTMSILSDFANFSISCLSSFCSFILSMPGQAIALLLSGLTALKNSALFSLNVCGLVGYKLVVEPASFIAMPGISLVRFLCSSRNDSASASEEKTSLIRLRLRRYLQVQVMW